MYGIESMMSAVHPPWHGIGKYVGNDPLKSAEAITAAGLDWRVSKRPVYTTYENKSGETRHKRVPGKAAIVRDSDNKALGIVGKNYEPIQNAEAFEFLDTLVDKGEIRFHTAGALKGGRVIWMLGKVSGVIEPVKGDITERYLCLVNGHDGKQALRTFWTSVRVVCMNTLNMALSKSKGLGVTIKHTSNVHDRIVEAQRVLGLAQAQFSLYDELAKALAGIQMPTDAWGRFVKHVIPSKADKDEERDLPTRTLNRRSQLTALFEGGIGTDIPGVRGTAWGALQAVTEYTTHHKGTRGNDPGARLYSSWFGSGDQMNRRALSYLANLASGAGENTVSLSLAG